MNNVAPEQVAKRLCYLWDLRERRPGHYVRSGLCIEKELIYTHYGSNNEIARMADRFFYEVNEKERKKIVAEGENIKLGLKW